MARTTVHSLAKDTMIDHVTVTVEEGDRQLILLALALCALQRPGFDAALTRIAETLGGKAATQMYDDFKYFNTLVALPRDRWLDVDGAVLWWRLPVREPPYVGTPLDTDWPFRPGDPIGWTRLLVPDAGLTTVNGTTALFKLNAPEVDYTRFGM
jgi:hypothetical protein